MNIFNRGEIAPSFTKCNRTPSSREQQARELAPALAGCTIKPTVVPGFTGVVLRPVRSNWIDPETRLKRKHGARRETERFREMAASLEVVQ